MWPSASGQRLSKTSSNTGTTNTTATTGTATTTPLTTTGIAATILPSNVISSSSSSSSNTRSPNPTVIYMTLLVIGLFFFGLLLISILIGFHPPQPDAPLIMRQHGYGHDYGYGYGHMGYHSNRVNDGSGGINENNQAKKLSSSSSSSSSSSASSASASSDTIFVAMPSLNDPDCAASVASAYQAASDPDRLFFGIYQQSDTKIYQDCLNVSTLNCPYHPLCSRMWQVRVHRVPPTDAQGPTWGRYMADRLVRNEKWYLITDSHTFFRKNWDDLLINLWHSTKNPYTIITHYPKGEDLMNRSLTDWRDRPNQASSYHICGTVFEKSVNRMPRNANGCYTRVKDLSKPILVPFWAGGFAFSQTKLLKEVPLDPHTPWLFHGEEFHFASRAWTHGYDFYSPPYDIMFHRYADRAKRGHMRYDKEVTVKRDASEKRVNALWGLLQIRTPRPEESQKANLVDLDKYPLGNKRTIQQFWKFVGVNVFTQNITVWSTATWASGGLKRVPWNPPFVDPVLNKVAS